MEERGKIDTINHHRIWSVELLGGRVEIETIRQAGDGPHVFDCSSSSSPVGQLVTSGLPMAPRSRAIGQVGLFSFHAAYHRQVDAAVIYWQA